MAHTQPKNTQVPPTPGLNLAGITKIEEERKKEKDSDRGSKMTPSCKCLIAYVQTGMYK